MILLRALTSIGLTATGFLILRGYLLDQPIGGPGTLVGLGACVVAGVAMWREW